MATEDKPQAKKSFSFDWLVGGVLTKLGDMFDRLTGRSWNPSSSLATSKLTEKLKFLLNSEVRNLGKEGKFVPHIIKLKIQWDKFSTDSEEDLDKLEFELHAAAIDHINDRLYHTYAPLDIQIKTDYFTDGVKLLSSFGKFSDEEDDEATINVTVPRLNLEGLISDNKINVSLSNETQQVADDRFTIRFTAKNKAQAIELNFTEAKRVSIGRSKENLLSISDQSVSKIHAAIVLSDEKKLMVADTGSTNGTFINEKRIAYGKAIAFEDDDKVKFGTVEVSFERQEVYYEEEFFEEEVEMTNEPEALATEAAVNYLDEELGAEIQPSQNEILKPEVEVSGGKEVIQPTIANPKEEILSDAVGNNTKNQVESEDFTPQPEPESEKRSQEINLDKTQDWEV